MSAVWGNRIKVSIFGESHGSAIGINIDGLPAGFEIDLQDIAFEMARRAPGKSKLSTSRKEMDNPEILSGFFEGKTTGAPLCGIIRNSDTRSKDYGRLKYTMRPGHADYSGNIRYSGFNDYRGGGHFSGRITAPLVFAGTICKQILRQRGIEIGAHVKSIGNVEDRNFDETGISKEELIKLKNYELPLLDISKEEHMRNEVLNARVEGDSIGGTIECAIVGIDSGIGNPFFDSVESTLAHLMFSVPAVKGIEFGKGFEMSKMKGSQCNDEYYYNDGKIKTKTNNNGGILGGITNGMPIIFKVGIKPTPSISKEQNTVDIEKGENTKLVIEGRHDPCIVQRALPVIESVAAIGILNLLEER